MGLMELRAAEQGGSNARGDGESPGDRGGAGAGEQKPGAAGERWRGSQAKGEKGGETPNVTCYSWIWGLSWEA